MPAQHDDEGESSAASEQQCDDSIEGSNSPDIRPHKNDGDAPPSSAVPLHSLIASYSFDAATSYFESIADPTERRLLASTTDENGDLPLHMCLKRRAPDELVLPLLRAHEGSVRVPSGLGTRSLPLHLAALHGASARIVVALIRRFPEALDTVDEDGDTPRSCVRKTLDPVARDAISKPTEYWSTLLAEVREEAEERAVCGRSLGDDDEASIAASKVRELEDALGRAQEELEKSRQSEKESMARVRELEQRVKDLEATENGLPSNGGSQVLLEE